MGMVQFRGPAHPRFGRLTHLRLLSLLSLCVLIFLVGWQVWQRVAQRADQQIGQLPSVSEETGVNAEQAPKPEEPADNNEFVFQDNSKDQLAAAATLLGLGVQGSSAASAEL